MNITNLGIKIPQISLKKQNKIAFTAAQKPDSFESSKLSPAQAKKEIQNIKNPDGSNRFNSSEVYNFTDAYTYGNIDVDTVKTFADTKLKIRDMETLYEVYKDNIVNGKDIQKTSYAPIHDHIKTIENDPKKSARIERSKFDKVDEIIVKTIKNKMTDETNTFSTDGNLIAKRYTKADFEARDGIIDITEDFKTNSVNKKYKSFNHSRARFTTTKDVTEYKGKNGGMTHVRTLKESEIPGTYNVQDVDIDGNYTNIATSKKDPKTGILTIKKDMKSPDGTRTQFLYEDDPQGNRIVDYRITDEKGKVIYNNSQTFEKISENKFITSNDSRKYEINISDKSLEVKNIDFDKKATINFRKKIKNGKNEIISLLKKIPGDQLFEAAEDVKKFYGLEKESTLSSYSTPATKSITSSDNLFVFLHELGHVKDGENLKYIDAFSRDNDKLKFSGDPQIRKTYMKELNNFVKTCPDAQREEMSYFLETDDHYAGQWGGLGELVAESNALGTTYNEPTSSVIGLRSHYVQQNFPKTISAIKDAMRIKDDIDAIEYYGT